MGASRCVGVEKIYLWAKTVYWAELELNMGRKILEAMDSGSVAYATYSRSGAAPLPHRPRLLVCYYVTAHFFYPDPRSTFR